LEGAVAWFNEETGVRYELVPGVDRERNGTGCREFTLSAGTGAEKSLKTGIACQSQPGIWELTE
jgi:hypothetical protein